MFVGLATGPAENDSKVGILLLGDSAERLLVRHLCEDWVGQEVELFNIRLDGEKEDERSCNRQAFSAIALTTEVQAESS